MGKVENTIRWQVIIECGLASGATAPEHNLISAKFKVYDILSRNSGGPGTTVMAVRSQQRNRIDNAKYELLVGWV
jgi:hypothetical protein